MHIIPTIPFIHTEKTTTSFCVHRINSKKLYINSFLKEINNSDNIDANGYFSTTDLLEKEKELRILDEDKKETKLLIDRRIIAVIND